MHTTLASWALVIWRALEGCRVDPGSVFDAAGIDVSQLRNHGQRVPLSAMQALWREAVERTGDPCFGLGTVRYIHPTTFHALGYAVMASDTLEDALLRIIRYGGLVSTAFSAELRDEEETLVLATPVELPPGVTALHDASRDAGTAAVMQLCRNAFGSSLSPVEVGVAHAAPSCSDRFYEFFRSPVRFGTTEQYLRFAKAVARLPLPTANSELARSNERIIHDYLARFDKPGMAVRVRARIAEQLPSGRVTESSIAAALSVSPRSMQRRLLEEGASFRSILDEMRRELAVQYVRDTDLSFNEIAYLLGYSEPASFTRAFRRWKGISPSVFRSRSGSA